MSLQDIPEHDRPWYEMLPAVAMDYKVHIDAGKEDCYFQYVQQGSTLYVSFHVIRGGDGMAGFAVRNPRGEIVHPYQWQASSDYTDGAAMGGFYAVCIDNQFSRFASKLVNLYITVIRYEEWEKFTKEIEDLNVNMNNFTVRGHGEWFGVLKVQHYLIVQSCFCLYLSYNIRAPFRRWNGT